MLNNERRRKLLRLLSRERSIATRDLPHLLETSTASALRDVAWLVRHNLATHRRGLVSKPEVVLPTNAASTGAFGWSLQQQAAQKRAIAEMAAGMCEDGESITISGGAATLLMAQFIRAKNLRILTNSFLVAKAVLAEGDNEVCIEGGIVDREHDVILSPFKQDLSTYHAAKKTFIGTYGISEAGLIETSRSMIQSEQKFIDQAEQLVVLVEGAKFHNTVGMVMCPLSKVSVVVTDTDAPADAVRMLERHGILVVQAELDVEALQA